MQSQDKGSHLSTQRHRIDSVLPQRPGGALNTGSQSGPRSRPSSLNSYPSLSSVKSHQSSLKATRQSRVWLFDAFAVLISWSTFSPLGAAALFCCQRVLLSQMALGLIAALLEALEIMLDQLVLHWGGYLHMQARDQIPYAHPCRLSGQAHCTHDTNYD